MNCIAGLMGSAQLMGSSIAGSSTSFFSSSQDYQVAFAVLFIFSFLNIFFKHMLSTL
jgi:hypothetical protein